MQALFTRDLLRSIHGGKTYFFVFSLTLCIPRGKKKDPLFLPGIKPCAPESAFRAHAANYVRAMTIT
jgi:hypothetical protein